MKKAVKVWSCDSVEQLQDYFDCKAPTVIPDLFTDGVKVERVAEYKYIGTVLDNK